MKKRILVTGSSGLVGTALTPTLEASGFEVTRFDIAASNPEDRNDVRDANAVSDATQNCVGIIHLAAVSRVVWGQEQPKLCNSTNVGGTRNIIEAALATDSRPWVVFTSSREVYGQADTLPVVESAALKPMNVYARSKVRGEELLNEARERGLTTAIVRLSNVYGSPDDYSDRVVPAFARGAVMEKRLRVDGWEHTFDFTHIDDTVRGLVRIIECLEVGRRDLPPLHLLPGEPTTLGELAEMAVRIAGSSAPIVDAPPRDYDVSHFFGDPRRTEYELEWRARIPIQEGLAQLIADFRTEISVSNAVQES